MIPETHYITSIKHKSDKILVIGVDRNVKTVFLDANRNYLMKVDYVVDNIKEINDKLYIDFRIFSKMKLDGNEEIIYDESKYNIERFVYDINNNTLEKS